MGFSQQGAKPKIRSHFFLPPVNLTLTEALGEITWWVLGYGDQVEVVEPPQLRIQVAEVASSVLNKYRES